MNLRAATGVPEGSPTAVVDGVTLAYHRHGRGAPLVCLHATGHGGGDFAGVAARFADRYEVIRLDWPGQGRSSADTVPASADRYATLLAGLLAQLGLERPVLLGNSIGGAAAIAYAARQPVRALVLCNPGGLMPVNAMTRVACAAFAAFFAAGVRGARWFPAWFRRYYQWLVLPRAATEPQRSRIIAAAGETAPVLHEAWQSFAKPEADLRRQAAALTVPVWFAWAKQDQIIPLWRNCAAIGRVAGATVTTFRGGHAAFLEDAEAFEASLSAFLVTIPNA